MIDVSYLWESIYGNDALKTRLKTDVLQNKLAHAYLIEGPANSGKLLLARTVAASMANSLNDVKKITSGACPDFYEISLPEKKKTIGIDTVREIKQTAYIKPNDLDYKFYVISHAECLTVQAQNALLKLIEEPPRNVYFFLLCENTAAMLATIRSRAPILRMQVFSYEELRELLLTHSVDAQKLSRRKPEALDLIARSSGGSYGEALLKIVEEENDVSDAVRDSIKLINAVASLNRVKILNVVQAMPPEREAFRVMLEKLRLLIRDILVYRATDGDCEFLFDDCRDVPDFADRIALGKLLALNDVFWQCEKDFIANPNIQNLKTQLYVKLCDI